MENPKRGRDLPLRGLSERPRRRHKFLAFAANRLAFGNAEKNASVKRLASSRVVFDRAASDSASSAKCARTLSSICW
jgi:hypothetical protein